jgi:dolichol-phosphate mannosyltransferase
MRALLWVFTLLQAIAAVRVFSRMARSSKGTRIQQATASSGDRVAVLLPVLNEVERLGPCLEGLVAQGQEVAEILVIDGGSTDGTQDLVCQWAERDGRITLVDASPVPHGVNGKAYGLAAGFARVRDSVEWVLTMDADVRAQPALVTSLIAHAGEQRVDAFSVATQQELSDAGEGVIHPSMLATLVYRFGIPGGTAIDPAQVQANGQCFFLRRHILQDVGGFSDVIHDVSEDVTLARLIAMRGYPVGFYESENLVRVEMYQSWRDAWDNWARSLPMRDRFTGRSSAIALAEATLVQALPLWVTTLLSRRVGPRHPTTMLNIGLVIARFGVLAGMSRAYRSRPWTYWISPLADVPVLARIWMMRSRRVHSWRGRTLVTGETE